MRTILSAVLGLTTLSTAVSAQQRSDEIFYGTLNRTIRLGQYDGVITMDEVQKHGDFGVGSSDKLGTELIMVDGVPYSSSVYGVVKRMPANEKLPFAAVKFFKTDKKIAIAQPLSLDAMHQLLDSVLEKNAFAAIKITGTFSSIKWHCYYPQQKPYKSIDNVEMKEFDGADIAGTIAGFYTPKSALVFNNPNYHFHFIARKETGGGHVDAMVFQHGTIEIDYASGLSVNMPNPALLKDIDLNQPMTEKDAAK